MVRSDSSAVVRQSALTVWKSVVVNTPKTLREIMKCLMNTIITRLSSTSPERRQVASHCLGDIVRKMGERVLKEIIPILQEGLADDREYIREGVCLGLSSTLRAATKRNLEAYMDILIPCVRTALCDRCEKVRSAAAQAFTTLQKTVGITTINEIVPSLLSALETDDQEAAECALHGLKEILSIRATDVMPYLVPKLVPKGEPMTVFRARAMAAVAEVTGNVLHYYTKSIMPALLESLCAEDIDESLFEAVRAALKNVVVAIEEQGINWLSSSLCDYLAMEHKPMGWRLSAAWTIGVFVSNTEEDFTDQVPMFLKALLVGLFESEKALLKECWSSLSILCKTIPATDMMGHLDFIRNIINSTASEKKYAAKGKESASAPTEFTVPGFNIPKGLQPLIPIFQKGLLEGSNSIRQTAASGLGDLIELTSDKSLRPYLVKLTGPLIRIGHDKFPAEVKEAILKTLTLLIKKGGKVLKPFIKPMQTTFIKSLHDLSRPVRQQAVRALKILLPLVTRTDPLLKELNDGMLAAKGGVRDELQRAISLVEEHIASK
jgi:HEAT repeat protein